jgi:TP901 family phage tail tape measure protein
MADIQSNINVNIDTSNALAAVKQLQAQISAFHSSIRNSGNAANQALSDNLTKNLVNSINATKQFSASLTTVNNRAQAFTTALEKNKFSLGQYFRYGAATTKTFGKVFRKEFNTIEQVASERVKTMQTQFITLGKKANGAFEAIKVKPLTLDMQNLGTQVAMTAQKQQIFNQLLTQGSTNLLNFGKNTQWAGRQLMVGLTIPLSLLGSAAMKTFSEMEEQAIRFKRVYGELFTTDAETDAMVKELDKLGRSFTKYGVAVADTMSLAADAAAMGKMGADLTAQVSEATRLAVLGGVEQSEALQTTISITNAFGTAAEDLAGKIDFLNAVENQTVTSIDDLTIAIPKAGPVIKELGGDVEDLAFFLTAMKEGGINASEGANALKSGLARMINPTRAATEFLSQFNININEIVEGNAGDIKSAVLELASALDTLDPLNKSRAIEELFGRFQFARISTLFNNVIAEGNQAQRVLQLTAATSEELALLSERELKRVEDSPLFKFQKAVEDVQKALMPLGQQFMELITPLLQFATRVLEGFNGLDEGVKKFITGAVAGLGLIAPVALMTFGLFANGIANLIKGFGLIRGLFLKVTYAGTGLSSQLSYMTQEHLEAASAANALGSTHGNLMNIFTAETGAIQNLIRAYDQATAAIQRNNVAAGTRARGGGGNGGMKLAGGIVSVPGPKGAGDIVPAMLSPGEAVVPADMAKKYGPLIQGMISDNIPGYAKGKNPFDKAHLQGALDPNDPVVRQQLLDIYPNYDQMDPRTKSRVSVSGALTAEIPSWMNQQMKGQGVDPSDFGSAWDAVDNKLLASAVAGGLDPNDPAARQALKEIESQVGQKAEELARKAGSAVTDAIAEEATDEILKQSSKQKGKKAQVAKQLASRKKVVSDVRSNFTGREFGAGLESGQFAFRPGTKQIIDPATGVVLGDERYSKSKGRVVGYKQKAQRIGSGGYQSYNSMATINDMDAAYSGAKQTARLKKAEAEGAAAQRAFNRGASKEAARNKKSDLYMKSRKRKSPHPQAAKDGADDARAYSQSSQKVMSREEKKLLRQQKAQRRAQIGGRAFGALGTASMIAGMGSMMGGPVGDISQKLMGPLMGLSAVAGLLPMLMNPIGLVVGALGGLAAAIYFVNKRFNDQVKKSYELNAALGTTTEAINGLATAAGNTTASQQLDRRRENAFSPYQVASGKTGFGQMFLDSDAGKQLQKSVGEAMETMGRGGVIDRLVQQLSTAVASGAIDVQQARSIGFAFAESIGDSGMGMDISARVNSLVGPAGENLLKDPLGVRVRLIQENREQFSNIIAGIAPAEQRSNTVTIAGQEISRGGSPYRARVVDPRTTPNATASQIGEIIAVSASLLDQQKEMTDSLQLEYEQRIANAKEAGDMAEAARLQAEYIDSRNSIMAENAITMKTITDSVSGLDNATEVLSQFKTQVETKFKDDPVLSKVLPALFEKIEGLDVEKQLVLDAQLLSGDIDPMTLNNVLNGEDATKVVNIITKLGGTQADRALELVRFFTGSTPGANAPMGILSGSPALSRADAFLNRVNTMNPTAAMNFLDSLYRVAQLGNVIGTEGVEDLFAYYQDNPEALSRMAEDIDSITAAVDKAGEKDLTVDVVTELMVEGTTKESVVAALRETQDYFDGLPDDQKVIYTTVLRTVFETGGTLQDKAIASARELGRNADLGFSGMTYDEIVRRIGPAAANAAALDAYKKKIADDVTALGASGTPTETGEGEGDGLSGATVTDPIDAILQRLKRLRDLAINAKGGIAELKGVIDSGLTKFFGTDQKLLFSGYSSDFINAVMSMDEGTRERFVKIKDGVLTVTSAGKALAKAYSEIKLGEFSLSLTQGLADTNKQIQAMNILQSRGLSNAESFDIVKDASLAYAIATAATTEEVDALIASLRKLEDAQYDLKTSTTAGMESEIGSAFNDIKEFFSAQEEAVNLAFEVNSAASNAIIAEAQNQIQDYQYVVDDLNYALDQIKEQEDEINEKYEKRVEALEKVSEVNQDIINQEKGQLSIAQALASGDIAAAAKAVQEYRADQAKRQQDRAKEVLDVARERELASITAENGKTRLEIEKELKDLQKEIAAIEEERLEPAQKFLRELQRQRDLALEAIGEDGYLGKTKKEWANVENAVRLAKVESQGFTDSIKEALLLIPQLKDAYKNNGTQEGPADDGLTQDQRDAIAKIKSNRQAVRDSDGTTAADKIMMQENIKLIKMLDAAGISRSLFMSGGGMVPKYYAAGGYARGTDSIPAMLTPGEFVVRKYAVDKFGADRLKAINSGAYNGGNMYNSYELNVNVKSDANPDQIARAVMTQIKQIDSQRMRSNRF